MPVCMCERESERVFVCACVCVKEREGERKYGRERARLRGEARESARETSILHIDKEPPPPPHTHQETYELAGWNDRHLYARAIFLHIHLHVCVTYARIVGVHMC